MISLAHRAMLAFLKLWLIVRSMEISLPTRPWIEVVMPWEQTEIYGVNPCKANPARLLGANVGN
jgi:hypothetical protein